MLSYRGAPAFKQAAPDFPGSGPMERPTDSAMQLRVAAKAATKRTNRKAAGAAGRART